MSAIDRRGCRGAPRDSSISNRGPQANADTASSKETFTVGNTEVKADVYRLAWDDLRPVILWIHPGALTLGNREMLPADQLERFVRAGYIVVAIDHRPAPETKLPEIVKDIEDAHQWIRDIGPTLFRIDAERVAAVGQSAGAYLALMAGARVQPRVKAVFSFYGYGTANGTAARAFFLNRPRITTEHAYGIVGDQVISGSPPASRMDFNVYCRQNGLWPQEVAGLDPDSDP